MGGDTHADSDGALCLRLRYSNRNGALRVSVPRTIKRIGFVLSSDAEMEFFMASWK